jgi:hypothetical protein
MNKKFFPIITVTCLLLLIMLLAFNGGYEAGRDIALKENSK